ncbi:hypothetical protein TrVGV298_001229 [Trichoderma virens]|nr:hypothetical protein TrVGV298_001229 [Trichoderma virens]
MELCERGNLGQYIKDQDALPETTAQSITQQVLDSLASMHGRTHAHHDLKPENILIARLNPLTVKITDFGFTKQTKGQPGYSILLGTMEFFPPEIILASEIEQGKVDKYCIDRVFPTAAFEIAKISDEAIDFIASLTKAQSSSRMTTVAAKAHKWTRSSISERRPSSTATSINVPPAAQPVARSSVVTRNSQSQSRLQLQSHILQWGS